MADRKRPDNIIKHPFRYPLTFVTVVFALIFIYLVIAVVRMLAGTNVRAYNVGTAVSDNVSGTFTGIVLRDESLVLSEKSGYVTFYASSGELLGDGSTVLLLSEEGNFQEKLHRLMYGQEMLSAKSRLSIRSAVSDAASLYDPEDFSTALKAKTDIREEVFQCLLSDGGENFLSALLEENYTTVAMEGSGFLMQYMDGFEGKSPEELYAEDFDENVYSATVITNGDRVEEGDFLYKIAADNAFTLVFLLSDTEASGLSDKTSLTIRTEDGIEITGSFSISETKDHKKTGVLTFSKYGANYMDTRFLSFSVLDNTVTGYKIPESAIVSKSFYVVDSGFITEGGAKNQKGVLVLTEGEAVFTAATVYLYNSADPDNNLVAGENFAYISGSGLSPGMTIISPNDDSGAGGETATLGVTASVKGVYQINNGYCVFRPVSVLENSIETSYVIVGAGLSYGIQPYDRILLDAADVSENDIVFE